MADVLSLSRLLLGPVIVWCGATGHDRLAAIGLAAAALTDVLDGRVARHRKASARGAHLDASADAVVMLSTAIALLLLHPAIAIDQGWLLAAVAVLYAAGTTATWSTTRRLVDPGQLTGKVAGATLYGFAFVTLATGVYVPTLLTVAALALGVSAVNAILAAITTIHANATASSVLSHAPHHGNGVKSSTPPAARIAASNTPRIPDTRP